MNDFHPLVSIVIPVYNGANYMREAIDSALAQTYDNCEVIVVNDGSCDNGETERIALSYGDKIRYFSKENGGVATALNLAIREMRGEYFSWLSHDDVYLPEKIGAQIRFMRDLELQEAIVYCGYWHIDTSGRRLGKPYVPVSMPEELLCNVYLDSFLNGCSLLIPRGHLVSAGGFPEDKRTTQDYELWFKLLLEGVFFVFQDQCLLESRLHSEQGSHTMSGIMQREVRDFYRRYMPAYVESYTRRSSSPTVIQALCEILRVRVQSRLWQCVWDILVYGHFSPKLLRTLLSVSLFQAAKGMYHCVPSSIREKMAPLKRVIINNTVPIDVGTTRKIDFEAVYTKNMWQGTESRSGSGSTLFMTRVLRRELPPLLKAYNIQTLLDAPCGDYNWMQHVDLGNIRYIGGDIVHEIVERNQNKYRDISHSFTDVDVVSMPLPQADAMLCRDCWVHLSYADIERSIRTVKESGIRFLLVTTFTAHATNEDICSKPWRPLNLCLPPFHFPEPIACIVEKCVEGGGSMADKTLGMWRVADLPEGFVWTH